jgi:predicted RNA-binding Zn ribbon-like protein
VTRSASARAGSAWTLDLCSTLLWRHVQPVEQLRSPADLARWRSEAGLRYSSHALTEADLATARRLREAIYRLVNALIRGARLPARDVAAVNTAARHPCRTPHLGPQGELRWDDGEPLAAALSAVARDAIELIGGPLSACYLTSQADECAFLRILNRCARRVVVRERGLRMIMCSRQRTHDHSEGRDG